MSLVPPFFEDQSDKSFEEYTGFLSQCNESLSLLLHLCDKPFEHLVKTQPRVSQALMMYILCYSFHQDKYPKSATESWHLEYIEMIKHELEARVLKLAIRLLETDSSVFCLFGLWNWISLVEPMVTRQAVLCELLLQKAFISQTALKTQFLSSLDKSLMLNSLLALAIVINACDLKATDISEGLQSSIL